MGYEAMNERMRVGTMGLIVIAMAMLTWLFGGSFREAMADGRAWIWPPMESDVEDAEAARLEEQAQDLMSSLDSEPPVVVARRFLNDELTADLSSLGAATASRVLALKVKSIDHRSMSDARLADIISGRDPEMLDRRVMRRIYEDLDRGTEPACRAI